MLVAIAKKDNQQIARCEFFIKIGKNLRNIIYPCGGRIINGKFYLLGTFAVKKSGYDFAKSFKNNIKYIFGVFVETGIRPQIIYAKNNTEKYQKALPAKRPFEAFVNGRGFQIRDKIEKEKQASNQHNCH